MVWSSARAREKLRVGTVSPPRLSQTHAGKPILQHIRAAPHERGAWTSVRAGH